MDTVKRKSLTINLIKVKAHSGNLKNDEVDLLAKQACHESIIEWCKTGALNITTLPVWNDIIIDMGTRDFVKVINKNKTAVEWAGQKRISKQWQNHIDNHHLYNWKALWSNFKGKSSTSIKNSNCRGF